MTRDAFQLLGAAESGAVKPVIPTAAKTSLRAKRNDRQTRAFLPPSILLGIGGTALAHSQLLKLIFQIPGSGKLTITL